MADPSRAKPSKLPLSVRLKAWWGGYSLDNVYPGDPQEVEHETEPKPSTPPAEPEPGKAKVPLWSAERIEVVERLWGPELSTPGGIDHIVDMVRPLGLNPTMTVLEIGAGLGGGTRAICEEFGCWITGYEQWPVLAEAGMAHSRRKDMDKKAPINLFDPDSVELKPKSYNAVYAKESLFTVPNKATLMPMIHLALRPGGQLVFTDYVIPESGKPGGRAQSWIESEPLRPYLWAKDDYVECLQNLQFDIRIAEDITAKHQSHVLEGWRRLAAALEPGSVAPATVPHLVKEAELWARRSAVLKSGEVKVYRYFAIKAGDAIR
jgi:SAM-dependent methyltransferase